MSSLESLNQELFLQLNAPSTAMTTTAEFASMVADYVLYVIPVFLVIYWIMGDTANKQIALKSVAVALLALGLAQVIGIIYPHPRPFMIGVGHTLIPHIADPSFPSDHMTLFSSIAVAFLLSKKYMIGLTIFTLGMLVAWSRIYLGVHFPFDMLGAFGLATVVALVVEIVWRIVGERLSRPFIQFYNFLVKRLFNMETI